MIKKLLALAMSKDASVLHISVGRPPVFRLVGRLRNVDMPVLNKEQTEEMMKEITPGRNLKELAETGSTDYCMMFEERGRFRVSAFRQQGVIGMVLRLLPMHFLAFEEIGIPEQVKTIISREHGLFLVGGPTGCGKTTTVSALVNYLNEEKDYHIITIEDPIEFRHRHKKGIVTQREIGSDVSSFADGLRRAFRQDPDLIVVGEMRDQDTTRVAIAAAESGHLVMGTVHTSSVASTLVRLIEQFPHGEQPRIRSQIATSLLGVISQSLVPAADGESRIAALEVMFSTPAVANLIRENKETRIPDEMLRGRQFGMITQDEYLLNLYLAGKIRRDIAIENAMNPNEMDAKINAGEESDPAAPPARPTAASE